MIFQHLIMSELILVPSFGVQSLATTLSQNLLWLSGQLM